MSDFKEGGLSLYQMLKSVTQVVNCWACSRRNSDACSAMHLVCPEIMAKMDVEDATAAWERRAQLRCQTSRKES